VKTRRGRCFELAYKTLMDSTDGSGWCLVYGTVVSIAHARLRNGTVVYDPVLDLICDADAYQGNAAVSYVTKEAAEMAVAYLRPMGPTRRPLTRAFFARGDRRAR
jgi:hypothetical protein